MHFYGGIVGTALAAVRENTKFNRRIVGATLRGRPKLIINNKKIFTHRVGRGLAPAEKLSVLNIEFGGLWASRPTMDL